MAEEAWGGGGWYPDPTRRAEQRWWDGTSWSSWIAERGEVHHDPLPAPPPTGGGELTSEPVVLARRGDPWALTSLYGLPLAAAHREGDAFAVLDPYGQPTRALTRSGAANVAVVVLTDLEGGEVGRYEEVRRAYLGGFRIIGAGALLATLDAERNDGHRLVMVDPGGREIGKVVEDHAGWSTELAHPFGAPLAELAALAALAIELAWL